MSIQMVCPNVRCRHMHSFPDEARGQVFQCIKCTTRFRIPAPPPPAQQKQELPRELRVPAAPFVF